MRLRLPVALIVLVAWVFQFTCVVPAFAHGCCPGSVSHSAASHKLAAAAACCQAQPVAQSQGKVVTGSTGGDDLPVASVVQTRLSFLPLVVHRYQSSLAHGYVPDQSGRHLELSVLLN